MIETFLRNLFPDQRPAPAPRPAARVSAPPVQPPAPKIPTVQQRLMAGKLVGQLKTIDRTYALNLITDSAAWDNDIAVILANDDLDAVSAEFLDHAGKCFYSHSVGVAAQRGDGCIATDGGLALPILDKSRLASARLLVHRKGREQSEYATLLKMRWSTAKRAPKESGNSFEDAHARKTTGGHGQATVHVGDSLRVELTVVRSGGHGFAFATDANGRLSVFCHLKHAPPEFTFAVGMRITAVLVQVPRGIQAREIRAVA